MAGCMVNKADQDHTSVWLWEISYTRGTGSHFQLRDAGCSPDGEFKSCFCPLVVASKLVVLGQHEGSVLGSNGGRRQPAAETSCAAQYSHGLFGNPTGCHVGQVKATGD